MNNENFTSKKHQQNFHIFTALKIEISQKTLYLKSEFAVYIYIYLFIYFFK